MKNKSILIVDDDHGMIDVIDKYVRHLGYDTQMAFDGSEAVKMLEEDGAEFDLLITDLVMPNFSGPKLIKTVREEYSQMKIIACTGYGTAAGKFADDAGADAILYKPIEMHQLQRAIEHLI